MANLQQDWWHSGHQLKISDQLKQKLQVHTMFLTKKNTINLQELSVNV